MRRRALIAGIGTVSTGCLGVSPPRYRTTSSDRDGVTAATDTSCHDGVETSPSESTDETPEGAEYRLTDLTVSTRTDRPPARYVLEPSAFYSGDAVERKESRSGRTQVVREISRVDDPARTAIETAIETGEWRSDSLPEGVAETVERVDFFTGVSNGGGYTHVGVTLYEFHLEEPPAIEFSTTIVDDLVASGDPGAIELELTNTSQRIQHVFSGTIPPFGMVSAEPVESGDSFLLWRNYEAEGCIFFTEDGIMRCSIGTVTELQPCERIARRYEVLPSDTDHRPEYTVPTGSGTYRISDSISYYHAHGAPESKLSFESEFALEAL